MSEGQNFTRKVAVAAAGVALVAALGGAVLSVYRRLPEDEQTSSRPARPGRRTTLLRVRLRREGVGFPVSAQRVPVQLYPINMAAARNEYDSEPRRGRWWIHAEIEGERELAWRLPVVVSGRETTVELTKENAYLRAKRF
jgi:hypothetical protein